MCKRNEAIVKMLLERHANVNTSTTTHVTMTPLHAAAKNKDIVLIEMLMDAGGKPTMNDERVWPSAMLMKNMSKKQCKDNETLLTRLKEVKD